MLAPAYADPDVTVYLGDCLDVLPLMPDASVHAIVTDPPYDLTTTSRNGSPRTNDPATPHGRTRIGEASGGFMGQTWDATGIAFRPDVWRECWRVLTPGGHLVAFGGTRTWHRLVCAIEDAGFEIRDSIDWLYGSGFPKSLDVGKAIDKAAGAEREIIGPSVHHSSGRTVEWGNGVTYGTQDAKGKYLSAPATDAARQWQGWGTALKPAHEPIVVARKPLSGTVAATVLAHGTGALNIDGCRVNGGPIASASGTRRSGGIMGASSPLGGWSPSHVGRWPANVVLSHAPDCDTDCAPGCPVAELDAQSGVSVAVASYRGTRDGAGQNMVYGNGKGLSGPNTVRGHNDSGGASRFFPAFRYQAKAPTSERPKVDGVSHATVKPLALMQWLVRLVTPPGGVVLDPFLGSGTTAQAARDEGFRCVGIEREAAYIPLVLSRLDAR
jgi:site-specific DNA-methyltransferase (adenine-specific)